MNKGFTLIEVVVAFAIAALVLGATARIFASAARHAGLLQHYARALALAEARLQPGLAEMADGEARGEAEGLRWKRRIHPYPWPAHAEPGWVPHLVTVEVRWGDPAHERVVSLSSIRSAALP